MRSLSSRPVIMARMDTTPTERLSTERLLTDLAEADPAAAPDVADELADRLARQLDEPAEDDG